MSANSCQLNFYPHHIASMLYHALAVIKSGCMRLVCALNCLYSHMIAMALTRQELPYNQGNHCENILFESFYYPASSNKATKTHFKAWWCTYFSFDVDFDGVLIILHLMLSVFVILQVKNSSSYGEQYYGEGNTTQIHKHSLAAFAFQHDSYYIIDCCLLLCIHRSHGSGDVSLDSDCCHSSWNNQLVECTQINSDNNEHQTCYQVKDDRSCSFHRIYAFVCNASCVRMTVDCISRFIILDNRGNSFDFLNFSDIAYYHEKNVYVAKQRLADVIAHHLSSAMSYDQPKSVSKRLSEHLKNACQDAQACLEFEMEDSELFLTWIKCTARVLQMTKKMHNRFTSSSTHCSKEFFIRN